MTDLRTILYDYLNTVLPEWLVAIIMGAVAILFWVIIGKFAIIIVKKIMYKVLRVKTKGARALTVAKLVSDIVKYVVWFVVVIMILIDLNVNITPFLASAGVVGLAIGFGAQEIVKDFLSGFFIIFEGSFNVDDVIEVDGFKGKVLEMGLRTTIIQNWKGEQKIINNGDINSLINFSKADSIAVVDFGVAYDTDLNKLYELMPPFVEQTKEKYENIIEMPSFLGVTELADSSINLRIIAKTKTMQHFQVERDIRRDIVNYFGEHDIEIPFPQVVIHYDKD